jgi:DNA polymerase-3 subunit alpha (Gram-positive type)
MLSGVAMMRTRIQELQSVRGRTAKEDDLLTMYQVAVEFSLRGLKFLPVDVKFSQAVRFEIEGNALRLPFVAVPGLGDSVAKDIVAKREEKMFTSKADVMKRTRLNKTLFDKFETMHAFNDLKDEDDEVEFGLFGIFE